MLSVHFLFHVFLLLQWLTFLCKAKVFSIVLQNCLDFFLSQIVNKIFVTLKKRSLLFIFKPLSRLAFAMELYICYTEEMNPIFFHLSLLFFCWSLCLSFFLPSFLGFFTHPFLCVIFSIFLKEKTFLTVPCMFFQTCRLFSVFCLVFSSFHLKGLFPKA